MLQDVCPAGPAETGPDQNPVIMYGNKARLTWSPVCRPVRLLAAVIFVRVPLHVWTGNRQDLHNQTPEPGPNPGPGPEPGPDPGNVS